MNINKRSIISGYALFLTGLFMASLGVAFSAKAGLGTSPVSAIPYSVSLVNHTFSFGGWLNILSIIQITVQVILLGKKCRPFEIAVQTVLAFAYGYMTNFSCFLIRGITVNSYFMQLIFMLSSCFILAFGIWLQLKGGVAMLPGEAMNRAISQVTKKKYENIKIFFDIMYILTAAAVCLIFTGRLEGVREGSVIAAVLVGTVIKWYNRIFDAVKKQISKS